MDYITALSLLKHYLPIYNAMCPCINPPFSCTILYYVAAKMWCYCRLVYMPMSYLYGKRFVGPITPLILQLRQELYHEPYHQINWNKVRHFCAKVNF